MALMSLNTKKPRLVRQIESTRQPLRLTKLTLARLCSVIGCVALVLGIMGLIINGDVTSFVITCIVIAVVGIGAWTVLAPDDLRSVLTGRQAAFGTNSIFLSILMVGIVAVIFTMSIGSGLSVDLTSGGLYSLKSDVKPVIDTLNRPLVITGFYTSDLLQQQSGDLPILRMFEDAAPNLVKLRFIDPNEEPFIAQQFGLTTNFGIYVSFTDAAGVPDPNLTEPMVGDYANERWIAEAILRLQSRGQFTVAFTTGSSELPTTLPNLDDASNLRTLLTNYGITILDLDLSQQDIPSGLTALLIIAPQRDFTQPVVDKISAYMASGGKLLLVAEPAFNSGVQFMVPPESPMRNYLWDTWGLRATNYIVFDPTSNNESAFSVRAAKYADDPMLNKDAAGTTKIQPVFYISQALQAEARDGVDSFVLFATSDDAFAIPAPVAAANPANPQRSAADLTGSLPLMIKAENPQNGAKIIMVGDSDWLRNSQITSFDGDILWSGVFDYLTSFVSKVTVNPVAVQPPLNVPTSDLQIVAFFTLLVMPGVVLLLGFLVWLNRLRHG
jgi:hypothetical protein